MQRVVVLLTAVAWIVLLCTVIPKKKIPVLTYLGKNTMPTFILHGFVIKLLGKYDFFSFPYGIDLLLSFVIAAALFALFENPLVSKAFKKIF